ncbi:hypothetical protein ACA910_004749 [Epithemia clementina (nom. ined.)]
MALQDRLGMMMATQTLEHSSCSSFSSSEDDYEEAPNNSFELSKDPSKNCKTLSIPKKTLTRPRPNRNSSLLETVCLEIAQMRRKSVKDRSSVSPKLYEFPAASAALIHSMPGNHRCVDCGARHPTWAAVSYGALLCLQCSGHHRSLGVQVSSVRSIAMDHVSLPQVLALLEGGNAQLLAFFERHLLTSQTLPPNSRGGMTSQTVTRLRYKTKAALFYRQHLSLHVERIVQAPGPYLGREQARKHAAAADAAATTHDSSCDSSLSSSSSGDLSSS